VVYLKCKPFALPRLAFKINHRDKKPQRKRERKNPLRYKYLIRVK